MTVTVESGSGALDQRIEIGGHTLVADEPPPAGADLGPAPHDLLLASLGACTSMTVTMVARRKGWPLEGVAVRLTGRKTEAGYLIERHLELRGDLSAEQREYLCGIAERCPVHKTLAGTILFETSLV